MTSAEKVAQLRALLCDTLLPLINNDYIFLDIPYYSNPGDTLIWEGTECLLKECSYKCLMKTAEECFKFPKLREIQSYYCKEVEIGGIYGIDIKSLD